MAKSGSVSSLVDEARQMVGDKGPRNDVERLAVKIRQADPKLYAEFVAAVNDHDLPASGLARALTARGWRIAEQSIGRFRRMGRTL